MLMLVMSIVMSPICMLGIELAPAVRAEREVAIYRATQDGEHDARILAAAQAQGLDPWLLKGLLWNESRLRPGMRGRWGVGIASFTPAGVAGVNWLRQRRRQPAHFTMAAAMNPDRAIPAAAELLGYLVRRFGRDGGVTAYNAGFAHGAAVARLGYHEAYRRGLLFRCGRVRMSGRYLVNVLRAADRFRAAAGLPPLDPPGRPAAWRRGSAMISTIVLLEGAGEQLRVPGDAMSWDVPQDMALEVGRAAYNLSLGLLHYHARPTEPGIGLTVQLRGMPKPLPVAARLTDAPFLIECPGRRPAVAIPELDEPGLAAVFVARTVRSVAAGSPEPRG